MTSSPENGPRPYVLLEANYRQLLDDRPNVAVLPWGATEAHNYHLPHGTDVIEAEQLAIESARLAHDEGAKPIVLPAIPFGNNAQQLDQVATVHCSTTTATAILGDVCRSLALQGIDRLMIVNGHGGNEFKPMVRDAQLEHDILIVVINFWAIRPAAREHIFERPGDHADEMETSLILHLRPELVQMGQAGTGESIPFDLKALREPGAWTPRPWSRSQPDTGDGDPSGATAEKGARYFAEVAAGIAEVITGLSKARKGDLPYI